MTDCNCTCVCHRGKACLFPPDGDGRCTACSVACDPWGES